MKIYYPGDTLGVLGSGQLGRMFAMAAKKMGYRVHVLSPDEDSPAGQVADQAFVVQYDDFDGVAEFAKSIDAATIEFENIPLSTLTTVERFAPVRPGSQVLTTIQNRINEKTFLSASGLPLPRFRSIRSAADLQLSAQDAFPAVLKTAFAGYDGKGQRIVRSAGELTEAWNSLGGNECVLEEFVDFECEFSLIAARGVDGSIVSYEPILNSHHDHILDLSVSPANLPDLAQDRATNVVRRIAEKLNYVGVLCVEFFLLPTGEVLVNEIAPRPHNSGHLTIEAHATSQFEQQVRATCGLPLGSADQKSPAAMVNLLGDCWQHGTPDWPSALECCSASLHLYGKADARPGRKMGHITCLSEAPELAAKNAQFARDTLFRSKSEVEIAMLR